MEINYLAVVLAAVAQFIVGAIWYMPIFGNLWGKMHGFNTLSKAEQAEAQKKMMPLLVVQFATTLLTSFVFALLQNGFPAEWNQYGLAFFLWLGFVFPMQVGAVIFGGTDPKWVVKKIAIMAGGSLACLLVMVAVFQAF